MVDCASNTEWGNFGCKGGVLPKAFDYTRTNALVQATAYPYAEKQNTCKDLRRMIGVINITNHYHTEPGDIP